MKKNAKFRRECNTIGEKAGRSRMARWEVIKKMQNSGERCKYKASGEAKDAKYKASIQARGNTIGRK